jgi:N-acetylmuramoyl-L-alanine amidase
MSAAKLLKKHELIMSLLKNGKHHTIYIYTTVLLCVFHFYPDVSASNQDQRTEKEWVIVIDPGHGGKDPGAVGSFSYEKNINLAIALKTGEYILQNLKSVKVIYTRKDDSTVDLSERPQIANRNNADLFISIHANWASSKNILGAETYIMGLAKDQENLEVAMKENEVILLEDNYSTKYEGFDPKSPESYIMFTLMQNVFQEQSTALASKIQTQFRERVERKDRGVRQAGFWVLFNTTMPGVLIETGYITNLPEEKYLNSKQGQDYLASAIFRACRDYINEINIRSGISAFQNHDPVDKNENKTSGNLLTGQLIFMVQIATAATRTELKPENFKGINDITEINAQDRFKYATGSFTDYSEAVKYRKKIEAIYPDAFVIAVKDNKILPLQNALEQNRKE